MQQRLRIFLWLLFASMLFCYCYLLQFSEWAAQSWRLPCLASWLAWSAEPTLLFASMIVRLTIPLRPGVHWITGTSFFRMAFVSMTYQLPSIFWIFLFFFYFKFVIQAIHIFYRTKEFNNNIYFHILNPNHELYILKTSNLLVLK